VIADGDSPDTWNVNVHSSNGLTVGTGNTHYSYHSEVPARAPREVPTPRGMHNLPPASAVFVGRDLDHLDTVLGRSVAGVVVGQVAVHGLGGIGKTELVIHYSHAVRSRYPLVWWITADSRDTIDQGLARLARRLQPTGAVTHAQDWAIDWLQAHPGWLLILDNVEHIADIQPLLGQLAGCGHVLVTTRRDPRANGWAPLGLAPLRLDPLGRADSVELLVRLTGNDDLDGADALAADLGDLPLALEQAAAYIGRHRGLDYHSYRDTLAYRFDKVSRHGGRGGDTERTIGQVWQITMATITEQSPLARTVLDVMAWLAPEELPQDVLYPLADDPDDILDAIALLADHNMIKWQDHTVSVHRLVLAVTRACHPGGEPRPADEAIRLLKAAVPTGHPRTEVSAWPRWNSLLTHIDALYARMPADHTDTRILFLAESAAFYRQFQGRAAVAIAMLERVLGDRRRVSGEDHPDTLRCLHNLALANQMAGQAHEAIAIYEPLVAIYRRVRSESHVETLAVRGDLANAYRSAGRADEAVTLHEQVLADRRRVLGDNHPSTLLTGQNLANAYHASGRLDEAIDLHELTLAGRRRVLGDDHPDTLSSRHNIAIAYYSAGRPDTAATMLEEVLADRQRVLGDDHPDTRLTAERLRQAAPTRGRSGTRTPPVEPGPAHLI
jgi:hypothetical protein